jgi:hypothetical protein
MISTLKSRMAAAGLLLGAVLAVAVLISPTHLGLLNPGPMMPGHEELACAACHEPAPGTTRQQLQAKVRHLIGWRTSPAAFGFSAPSGTDCLACHARPDDRHPIHRFMEPRFASARETLGAHSCIGCHREHRGARISAGERFCASCHEDLKVAADPLDVSHATLVSDERWETCLGCHDFHGNHARTVQRLLADAHSAETIRDYLARGRDPYASSKIHPARSARP